MPKVSVVCIVFNSMAYLPETVGSVLAQSLTDFELIIVDDGSSDGVAEWAATLTDPRVRFVSQANQGIPGARNTGIAHSRGEYIAFLDGDDLWSPLKLEKQAALLERHPEVGLVHTHTDLIDASGRRLGRSVNMNAEGDVMSRILVSNFVGTGSSPMVRRRCFSELGPFYTDPSIAWCDDWDMWVRIAARYRFAVVREPLTLYRLHPRGASTKYRPLVPLVPAIVERLYEGAPPHLQPLRAKTYGTFYLYLAVRALGARGYADAWRLFRRALRRGVSLRWLGSGLQIGLTMLAAGGSRRFRSLNRLPHVNRRGASTP